MLCIFRSLLIIAVSHRHKQAQTNLTQLNDIVWGTCNTDTSTDQCGTNMATFESTLQSVCSKELSTQNAMVVQALQGTALLSVFLAVCSLTPKFAGFQGYNLMRNAGCLADQVTNSYCYVEAAHSTSPSDLYFYQLPAGIALPNTTTPSCSSCTKSLMGLYSQALQSAPKGTLTALQSTYSDAEKFTVAQCGSGYAATSSGGVSAYRGLDKVVGVSVAAISCIWALLWLMPW